MHISQKLLHQTRRLLSFFPDQENLRLQGRLRQGLYMEPLAEAAHGFRENRHGQPLPHPEHGSSRVVAEAENIWGQILGRKSVHDKFFISPVQNQRAVHEVLQSKAALPLQPHL